MRLKDYPNIELCCDQKYFDEVMAFAEKVGKLDSLKKSLDWLNGRTFFGKKSYCKLFKDFAPYSFEFLHCLVDTDEGIMNGGLIFHGPHDGYGSGSAPTFSVSLSKTDGWQIHT